jgi:aminopeptidase N
MRIITRGTRLTLSLALVASLWIGAAQIAEEAQAKAPALAPAPLLSTEIIPHSYALRITPDKDRLTFEGLAQIKIEVRAATRHITVNAVDLSFSAIQVLRAGKAPIAGHVTTSTANETASFSFSTLLAPGVYTLEAHYTGKIQDKANDGLFIERELNGDKRGFLFTHMEPASARRLFPSWDAPAYKAAFDLTVIAPKGETAFSNMAAIETTDAPDNKTRFHFATTPRMSSYLVFMAVGPLDRVVRQQGAIEYGLVARKQAMKRGDYALDLATRLTPWFESYFGSPYQLPKLDLVLGLRSAKTYTAMENWGAILSSEEAMLTPSRFGPATTSKNYIALVSAHEISHQWIGNLVTPISWDQLWLSEATASWIEKKALISLDKVLSIANWRLFLELDQTATAKAIDIKPAAPPIINTAYGHRRDDKKSSTILYLKGGAVVSMLEEHAGTDRWQAVLRRYIKAHENGSVHTNDLIAAMEAEGVDDARAIVTDFTAQSGLPIITVTKADCVNGKMTLSLSQSAQTALGSNDVGLGSRRWAVPVTAQSLNGARTKTIVKGGTGEISLPSCDAAFLNPAQVGYYRTLYAPAVEPQLIANLSKLSALDQNAVLMDALSLADEGQQSVNQALNLLYAVSADAAPQTLKLVADRYITLLSYFKLGSTEHAVFSQQIAQKLGPALDRLGFAEKASDDSDIKAARYSLILLLGSSNYKPAIDYAKANFAPGQTGLSALDSETDAYWAILNYRFIGEEAWRAAAARILASQSDVRSNVEVYFIGSTIDPKLAEAALDLARNPALNARLRRQIVAQVGANFPERALAFALTNQALLASPQELADFAELLVMIGNASLDRASAVRLETEAKARFTEDTMRDPILLAAEGIKTRAACADMERPGILAWARQPRSEGK